MSAPVQHLNEEQLLQYADGELAPRDANQARSHLEACWQCRVEFEELQKTIAECIRYRKEIQQFLPPPPSPWADIYPRFGEIDRSLDRPTLFQQVGRRLQWPVPKWVLVPLALFVAAVLIYRFEQAPPVQAAELLRQAVVAADSQTARPRMIQIRTKHRQVRRLAGPQGLTARNASPEMDSLAGLFAAAHYNWDDPLSAKSYQQWRDQLPEEHDEVIQKDNQYLIRTTPASGPLTEATLQLKIPDLRPVEEHFQFGESDWVEVTELSAETAAIPTGTLPEAKETLRNSPASPALDAPSPALHPALAPHAATVGEELQVLMALHKMSADLGDPIEVSRSGAQVLVTGTGISPQRQQEIRTALASNANVMVRFSEPVASASPAPSPHPEGAQNADMSQLQARVAEKLGGRVNFDELSAQVLDLTDQMMSRAYALRRLAERFPTGTDATLSPADLQVLANLRQEHTTALLHQSAEIDRVLRPVFTSLGVGPHPPSSATGLSLAWQPATEEVFQSARQVEKSTAVMFGAAPSDPAGPQIPAQLMASLSQLRTRLAAYAKIGTEETDRKD